MTRTSLHQLVDQIPEAEIDDVAALVDAYRRGDRVMIAALTAPVEAPDDFEIEALTDGVGDDPRDTANSEKLRAELGLS